MANNTTASPVLQQDISPYLFTELASAIYLSISSPITVGANGLLLAAIYKDPLKCFRTPVTYFIIGLALVDLLTGLTVEPFFATYYFVRFFRGIQSTGPAIELLVKIASFISTIGLSSSFLIVLALSCSQFIAINFPHKYRVVITTRRVVVCITVSLIYFTCFSLIQLSGNVSKPLFYQIDLYLHATLIPVLLLVSHAIVLRSFQRYAKKSEHIGGKKKQSTYASKKDEKRPVLETKVSTQSKTKNGKSKVNQRQLTIVTLLLSAVLLLCSLPHTIVFYLFLYKKIESFQEDLAINIALRVSDDILFLKVLLDPFIYCWRLPKYRTALKNTLLCGINRYTREAETQEMTTEPARNESLIK